MCSFPPVAESPSHAVDEYLELLILGHCAQLATSWDFSYSILHFAWASSSVPSMPPLLLP